MDRSEEVIDNEVSHVVAEVRSGSEVKAEVDSGKYSAEGRLLGCGGEAAKWICHAPQLERINSRTAFAAFTNGGAAAIIITQNTTASQAECWGASFIK
jgi:hypothetical protein